LVCFCGVGIDLNKVRNKKPLSRQVSKENKRLSDTRYSVLGSNNAIRERERLDRREIN